MTAPKKIPVVQRMAAAAAPAVVEKAQEKDARGDDLSQREQKALAAQAEIDYQRGYRRIEWKPGVWHYQAINGLHTDENEQRMIAHVNEQRLDAADPFNQRG